MDMRVMDWETCRVNAHKLFKLMSLCKHSIEWTDLSPRSMPESAE